MKTVQEVLQQTDRQQLIDNYLIKYPLELEDFEPSKTIGEVEKTVRQQLTQYLVRLENIDVNDQQGQYVFYAYHKLEGEIPVPTFALVDLEELQHRGDGAPTYSYIYSPQADIMGFLVANNSLTNYYKIELLVEIMHEAAFFGFNQEELPAASRNDTKSAVTQIKNQGDLQLTVIDKFSEKEQSLVKQISVLKAKIADSSRHNAVAEILQG